MHEYKRANSVTRPDPAAQHALCPFTNNCHACPNYSWVPQRWMKALCRSHTRVTPSYHEALFVLAIKRRCAVAPYVGQLLAYIAATLKLAAWPATTQDGRPAVCWRRRFSYQVEMDMREVTSSYRSVSLWIVRRNKQLPLWRRTDECEVEPAV